MIRNEVDMTRKLVVQRVEGALTPEDLRNDAKLWSMPGLKDYATVFNLGSADVSDVTVDSLKLYLGSFAPNTLSSVQAIVAHSDEQRQAAETVVQLAVQAGFPAERARIFDNEEDAIDWVVENHPHGN